MISLRVSSSGRPVLQDRFSLRALAIPVVLAGMLSFALGVTGDVDPVQASHDRDTFDFIIDVDDSGERDIGYEGQDSGSEEHGWKVLLKANYEESGNPSNTYSANILIQTDGSFVGYGGSDPIMQITGLAPIDNPDFACDTVDYFDRYRIQGDAWEEFDNNGVTFELVSFSMDVVSLNVDFQGFSAVSVNTCVCQAFSSCTDCTKTVPVSGGSASHTAVVHTASCF